MRLVLALLMIATSLRTAQAAPVQDVGGGQAVDNSSLKTNDARETHRLISVLQTYVRFRSGIAPSLNAQAQKAALTDYRVAFANARDANEAIAKRGDDGCKRFIALYNSVGGQLAFFFDEFMDPSTSADVARLIEPRLRILRFFEQALFSLVLLKAEAGLATLDPGVRHTCETSDRDVWTRLLLVAHQKLEATHEQVLGEPSVLSDETEAWKEINEEYSWDRMEKQVAWMAAEVTASMVIWDKFLAQAVNNLKLVTKSTLAGKAIQLVSSSAYILGWVAFDRHMRTQLPFLMPPPEFKRSDVLSAWEDLMKMGEDFTASSLVSPSLYYAYAELLSMMRKRAAYEFLRANEWTLTKIEQQYGSIENAIDRLKEVPNGSNDTETWNTHRMAMDPVRASGKP